MCRIAGIWKSNICPDLEDVCIRMRDCMTRGGPDHAGIFLEDQTALALGHRRLSIIDLSETGNQPMRTSDGRYILTYNGEVYNYQEIREDLAARGVLFRGTSDTEVVLQAFAAWGPHCVQKFIGMFAFAVWDSFEKSLYLFRDRVGVKPLYYYHHEDTFAFASELKALHIGLSGRLEVDIDALGEFFHYGYISSPRSIYRNTWKLEPGHWLKVSSGFRIEKHEYWSSATASKQSPMEGPEETLIDRLEESMVDAFTKRLIADVPVGVFLSGGVDSSLVTAILAKHSGTSIKTFTIGFREKNYDESRWAKQIALHLGTEHTEEFVTPEHAREILPLWPEIYDEPFGDISGIPTTIVSRMTRHHVKVSLSADGGDELFCGYHRYWVMYALQRFISPLPSWVPKTAGYLQSFLGSDRFARLAQVHPRLRLPAIKDRMRKFQAVLANWSGNASGAYSYAIGYWLPHEVRELTGSYHNLRPTLDQLGENLLDAMMLWDFKHYLPENILTKVDRATMFNGLEGRDPFLDHRIVEFARALPLEMKFRNGQTKYILRQLLKRYLPEELFSRPKQGFAVPIYSWLHDEFMDLVDEYLNYDSLRVQSYLNLHTVQQTVSEFRQKNGSIAVDRIWLLLVFMMWRQRYGM